MEHSLNHATAVIPHFPVTNNRQQNHQGGKNMQIGIKKLYFSLYES